MTYPVFASGDVLNASDMNGVGLWLVKSQTVGTGVASVTVTGAFSADYDNYKIIYTGFTGSAVHNMQLLLGGTTIGYYGFGTYGVSTASTVLGIPDNNAARFGYVGGGGAYGGIANVDVYTPFIASQTQVSAVISVATNFGFYGGRLDNTTSYTAFTLRPDTGTLTTQALLLELFTLTALRFLLQAAPLQLSPVLQPLKVLTSVLVRSKRLPFFRQS